MIHVIMGWALQSNPMALGLVQSGSGHWLHQTGTRKEKKSVLLCTGLQASAALGGQVPGDGQASRSNT
jgi:hypothetical protein